MPTGRAKQKPNPWPKRPSHKRKRDNKSAGRRAPCRDFWLATAQGAQKNSAKQRRKRFWLHIFLAQQATFKKNSCSISKLSKTSRPRRSRIEILIFFRILRW